MVKKLVLIILLLILVGIGGYFGYRYKNPVLSSKKRTMVYLDNGQVYFGFVSNVNSKTITIKDVYYVKSTDKEESKIVLSRLGAAQQNGNNLFLNRDQVLFFQTVKDDSKINEAIKAYAEKTASQPK